MPGPTFKKLKETSPASHQMEICRLKSRVGTSTPSTASAGSNLGTSIEDAGSLVEKKKRKKRKKSSRLKSVKGAECTGGHVQTPKKVKEHKFPSQGDCKAGCIDIQDVIEPMVHRPLRGTWPGDGAETSAKGEHTHNLEMSCKKQRRIQTEALKEERNSGSVESVATKKVLTEGERVWQYVCKRAVLVDPKGHIRNPLTSIGSLSNQSHSKINPGHGKRTLVSEVVVAGKRITVTNTKEGAVAQDWILRQGGTVFGLDAEWRPSFRKGIEHKISVLQVCSDSECLIIQMLFLDLIPWALIDFLKDPDILFPGVGINGDVKKLQRDWGLECRGAVDLTTLAAKTLGRPQLKTSGLKELANVVINYDMAKPKRVTMSNWAKPTLDQIQVHVDIGHSPVGTFQSVRDPSLKSQIKLSAGSKLPSST